MVSLLLQLHSVNVICIHLHLFSYHIPHLEHLFLHPTHTHAHFPRRKYREKTTQTPQHKWTSKARQNEVKTLSGVLWWANPRWMKLGTKKKNKKKTVQLFAVSTNVQGCCNSSHIPDFDRWLKTPTVTSWGVARHATTLKPTVISTAAVLSQMWSSTDLLFKCHHNKKKG